MRSHKLSTKWDEFVGQTVLLEVDYTAEELSGHTTIESGKFGKPRGAIERYLVLKFSKQDYDSDFSESQLSHRSRTNSELSQDVETHSEYSSAIDKTVITRKSSTQFYNDSVFLETFANQSECLESKSRKAQGHQPSTQPILLGGYKQEYISS